MGILLVSSVRPHACCPSCAVHRRNLPITSSSTPAAPAPAPRLAPPVCRHHRPHHLHVHALPLHTRRKNAHGRRWLCAGPLVSPEFDLSTLRHVDHVIGAMEIRRRSSLPTGATGASLWGLPEDEEQFLVDEPAAAYLHNTLRQVSGEGVCEEKMIMECHNCLLRSTGRCSAWHGMTRHCMAPNGTVQSLWRPRPAPPLLFCSSAWPRQFEEQGVHLLPLFTTGDGHCLTHSISRCLIGFEVLEAGGGAWCGGWRSKQERIRLSHRKNG